MLVKQREQPVRVVGKLEEISLLLRRLHRSAAVRTTTVHQLTFRPKTLARRTVKPLILTLVDVTLVVHLHKDFLHTLDVARLSRADKVVIRNLHRLP